jgi:hypothetical protein
MPLMPVEWRYVGVASISSNGTVDTIMNAIYTLATSSTYQDGSSRSNGTGSAGTWGRYQNAGTTEALHVTPNAGSAKILIAGSNTPSPSPSPTMASPDTYTRDTLMMNITKNAGAFSSWNNSNPFTSGSTFGYWKILGSRATANIGLTTFTGNIHLYESKESVAVFFISTGASTGASYSNGGIAGALWDPESSHSSDAETDGNLYGMITSGHATAYGIPWNTYGIWGIDHFNGTSVGSAFYNNAARGFIHGHASDSSNAHCGLFAPGTSTIKYANLLMTPNQSNGSSSLRTPSGRYVKMPMVYKYQNSNEMVGKLRGISFVNRGLIGQRHVNNGSVIGYTVGCSDWAANPGDCMLLEY